MMSIEKLHMFYENCLYQSELHYLFNTASSTANILNNRLWKLNIQLNYLSRVYVRLCNSTDAQSRINPSILKLRKKSLFSIFQVQDTYIKIESYTDFPRFIVYRTTCPKSPVVSFLLLFPCNRVAEDAWKPGYQVNGTPSCNWRLL